MSGSIMPYRSSILSYWKRVDTELLLKNFGAEKGILIIVARMDCVLLHPRWCRFKIRHHKELH